MKEHLINEKIPAIETVTELLYFRETSEYTALICGEESLSYRQLVADAKKIAHCLTDQGLQKGDRVLLSIENSINVIRAIFGILLAGGVYVAADTKWPEERLRQVSEEASVSVRITDEMVSEFIMTESHTLPLPAVRQEDEAAIYYTSGSTGTPKGTVLHHRIILAYANPEEILQEYYERDRFLTFPVFTSVIPVILALMFTAYEKTLVVAAPQEMSSIDRLTDCIIRNRVQSIVGTPSFLLRALEHPLFAKAVREQVTLLAFGGEMLKEADAVKLFSAMENGALSGGYGSSETYICSMSRCEPGKEIRLERFPKGVELYVLDEDLKPVSPGEEGEVFVGGVCAQYGHYLDPELNRKKYVDHPVYGRCFRIGDGARLDEEGRIILLGRIDHMIKLHGLRIEPSEVETVIEQYSGIRRAAVALKEEQLCGYYTAENEIDESSLRRFLSERLPYYMIPSVIIHMETLPVSGNGKLDYKSLPAPEKDAGERSAPVNEREKLLCSIFGEVLNMDQTPGAEDSFFMLGGDSIHALAVAGLLEKEGFSLELKDIFIAPTPKLLAPLLKVREECSERTDDLKNGEGTTYPVTRHVESRFKSRGGFYPVSLIGEIDASVSAGEEEQLRKRLTELSEKHDALRSRIMPDRNGNPLQVVQTQAMTEFFHVDLREISKEGGLSDGQKRYLASLIRMELSEGAEFGDKVAFRLGHIRISEDKAILFCGFSHYILDGIGIAVILRELLGRNPVLPDSALWQRRIRRLSGEDRDQALAYWKSFFDQAGEAVSFPAEEQAALSGHSPSGQKKSFFMSGGRKLYEALKESCAKRGTTLSILMTYAVGKALAKVQKTDNALFYTMGTGRNASEMQLPGMFTVSFPVYLKKEDSLEDLQRQLIRSERHAWIFGLPDVPLPSGEELLNLNVQNVPLPTGFRVILPTELEDATADPEKSLWNQYFAVTDTPLEIQAYPDERFGFMGWCETGRFDATALETLLREALKELKQFSKQCTDIEREGQTMENKATILEVLEGKKDREETAVICRAEELSYRELVQRAQHIARTLIQHGVRKGDCVMLSMDRSVNAVCAIFGIFYAGAVFVATDSRWPKERMEFVKTETNSVLQLDDDCFQRLLASDAEGITLPAVTADDVAAIIFTSGSTGVPKGVVIHHKVLQIFVAFEKLEDDSCLASKTILSVANFTYVLSLLLFTLAFNYGKTILLSTDEEMANPALLAQSMTRYQVDFFPVTPSVALRLLELPFFREPFFRLRSLALVGELVTPQAAEKIAGSISGTLWIHYGSTEAGEIASYYWRKGKEICLGTRAEGTHIYLLDEDGEEVGPEEEGEIFISGPCADCGYYLNRPEITKEKYPVHPKFGRLFQTGDFGRQTKDGDIALIGRKDGMVKLNGQRIEVEEVEAAIEAFPGIQRAAVCVQKTDRSEILCAYYTSQTEINERQLREQLSERLPMYMIPAFIKALDELPENASGKLDRKRLPIIRFPKIKEIPLVSVLTPVHKTDLTLLERAASSVKEQNYPADRIEWIVGIHNMDDAYRKEAEERLGKMENVRIFALKESTKTLGAIRNALLDKANGTYLFWLDADDELTPSCISRAVEAMEEGAADLVTFPFREEAEKEAWYIPRRANVREKESCVYEKQDPRIGALFAGGGVDVWCWGYRTAFLKKAGIRFDTAPYSSFGDCIFLIDAVSQAGRIAVLPGEEGYIYYVYAGSDLQNRTNRDQSYEACLSVLYLMEKTKELEQRKTMDLNDWRWTLLTLMLSFFANPIAQGGQKEEIREKMRPWVDRLRATDPSLLFPGRTESNVAAILYAMFPEEIQKHSAPVFGHIRLANLPYTDPEELIRALKERMQGNEYHLIPDDHNPFLGKYREEALPQISFVDLTKADSPQKKEERIRSYIRLEELRGFEKDEVALRITQFRMEEKKGELLLTWDGRYISELAVDWLKGL